MSEALARELEEDADFYRGFTGQYYDGYADGHARAAEKVRRDWASMPENVWRETHYFGLCKTCKDQGREVHVCDWISCPTGGWWSHRVHPDDHHDADIGWQPEQDMSDDGHYFTVGAYEGGGS
ncbi:hypothetical protein JRC04_04620 [Mycolicibacterium sp. S2-37]|uniref:hypothetical protein n=1 Tax=Mycolicibacterium sp. S2-37 TaxID=2810297 RepID=UPI001A95028E|nr:hypothetical protein [Mycolicibacterium sp. S2-37]MBO0676742.1 hypothetical protein [Mycolicibacterium sp. S2-37]